MELELIKKVVGSGLAFNLTHIEIGTETTLYLNNFIYLTNTFCNFQVPISSNFMGWYSFNFK